MCVFMINIILLLIFSGPPEKKMGIKASNTAEVGSIGCFGLTLIVKSTLIK